MKSQLFLVFVVLTVFSASAELPASYYSAIGSMKNENSLCVKNYDAGASITESYTDFESLDKDTTIVSRSGANNASNPYLEANINSLVIGKAHLAWQSVDPYPDIKGRHYVFSQNEENLTGVFSIERLIQLAYNGTLGGGPEWLPCG